MVSDAVVQGADATLAATPMPMALLVFVLFSIACRNPPSLGRVCQLPQACLLGSGFGLRHTKALHLQGSVLHESEEYKECESVAVSRGIVLP